MIDQAKKNRQPIPARIADKPVLANGLEFAMEVFVTLSTCRPIGMSVGPIPWLAVRQYASCYGIAEEDFTLLWELIQGMDRAYLEKQSKQKAGKTPPTVTHSRQDVSRGLATP